MAVTLALMSLGGPSDPPGSVSSVGIVGIQGVLTVGSRGRSSCRGGAVR